MCQNPFFFSPSDSTNSPYVTVRKSWCPGITPTNATTGCVLEFNIPFYPFEQSGSLPLSGDLTFDFMYNFARSKKMAELMIAFNEAVCKVFLFDLNLHQQKAIELLVNEGRDVVINLNIKM